MAPPVAVTQNTPQLKRPIDIPEEKLPEDKEKKSKKNVKGPRAVAVLQLTSSGKGTLIPIAILVDGKFYDASVYKADPVPMALESGTVYEAEQAGDSLGLFTVRGVLHSKTPGAAHPWLGAGSYLPKGVEGPKTTRKAEDVPVGIGRGSTSSSDDRPRLTRGNPSAAAASSPAPAPASSTTKDAGSAAKPGTAVSPAPSQPTSSSQGSASTGPDAPKPATPPASDKADQNAKQQAPAAPGQSSPGQSSPGQSSPAQASQGKESQAQASSGKASQGQSSENYYRPTLRRGKPTDSAPEEDLTALNDKSNAGKPVVTGTIAAVSGEPVKLVAAVSDAGGPDPRPFKFFWKAGEEDDRRQQMLALATDEVQAYANALAKNRIPATAPAPAKKTTAGHKAPAKPVPPVLENVQFRTFDVWVNNQPVIIFSAEAHFPPAPGASAAPEQYSITLVARTDIYGNLRKLYSGVTDKFHLDVTPRLELIDAIDADGDGRGELLFRETTEAGSGYVIYRPTGDKLFKMFDTLAE
jgi:hypothetical protein